jgi:hypothetical protein
VNVVAISTPQAVTENGTLSLTPSATLGDCATGPVTWSISPALPAGATFSTTSGAIAWTPACGAAGSYGPFTLTAMAASGESGASDAFAIQVAHQVGSVSVAAIGSPQTIAEMSALTITPSATLGACAATPLTWTVSPALPSGATLDAASGQIAWTPSCSAAEGGASGSYGPFTLTATAASGESGASSAFSIAVTDVPTSVAAPTGLTATQVVSGNPVGDTTGIVIHFNAVAGATAYRVYRAPFGHYPYYDDAGGSAPSQPSPYPPPAPWTLTGVTADGGTDTPPARDFWYYVVYALNDCGDLSAASAMTTGTLDYFLGDVSDGVTHGLGNNRVQTEDLSEFGAHYGELLTANDPLGYLDIGPTSTRYVSGRPMTDRNLNFEDLVLFAINFYVVSAPAKAAPAGAKAAQDLLVLSSPARVAVGDAVDVPVRMEGTGLAQAFSLKLSWDPAIVRPTAPTAGAMLRALGGLALSPAPGTVDVATLGVGAGLAGDGDLVSVRFEVIAAGDPQIRIASVDARDARNQPLAMGISSQVVQAVVPTVTRLHPAVPNPFRQQVGLPFSLARPSHVELGIYSVDGRRVRLVTSGSLAAGEYHFDWDGRDETGQAVAAGVYYARLTAGGAKFTRTLTLLK